MTAHIEDVSSLPGRKIRDQDEALVGEVKAIYARENGFPMWLSVETKTGLFGKSIVYIPLARLKEENDELLVQYSKQHIVSAPKPDDDEEISAECDRELRTYYGIGTADQEMWTDNKGYHTMVPEELGGAQRVDDPDDLETPDADTRTDETKERVSNPGSSELRDVSADSVFDEG